ncbi:hypothetical protein D9M71_123110 [compost metagenome]
MATTAKPRPYSPAFSASMAAFSDSRLVWSATLTMVVTTWLMLPARSLRIASLALTSSAAPITWRMVCSMRARPSWPEPANTEVCSAADDTSFMVRTRSRQVAAISWEVAPISVVVAAVSLAVTCCCLEVAAISVTEVVTWIAERCAWATSPLNSSAMPLKPASITPNSSLRSSARRAVRSPPPITPSTSTTLPTGAVMARISSRPRKAAAAIASSRELSMVSSASRTSSRIRAAAPSAMRLFSAISSFSVRRPSSQPGCSWSSISSRAAARSLPYSSRTWESWLW